MIRWGILGCGRIARKFAADLQYVSGSELIAVGSRSRESAAAFANEFPVTYQHDSYEALAANEQVDVIYIATPHNLHYENTILCLNHHKAVLCEKPFAMNLGQAKEMIAVAKARKLFLMEALWTKFLPHYSATKELIDAGKIGVIKSMLVNFGFRPMAPIPKRLYDPELGGGTIMDIGIYNIFLALSFLGKPDMVSAVMTPATSGVDEQCSILFNYANGAMAQLFSTFCSDLPTEAEICGDEGRIKLGSRFYEPSTKVDFFPGKMDSRQEVAISKEAGFGYQYEARHVVECLQKGLMESTVMKHEDTLLLMEMLDKVRLLAGVKYKTDFSVISN